MAHSVIYMALWKLGGERNTEGRTLPESLQGASSDGASFNRHDVHNRKPKGKGDKGVH